MPSQQSYRWEYTDHCTWRSKIHSAFSLFTWILPFSMYLNCSQGIVPEELCSRCLNFLILPGPGQQSEVQIDISSWITSSAPCTRESWPRYCCPASNCKNYIITLLLNWLFALKESSCIIGGGPDFYSSKLKISTLDEQKGLQVKEDLGKYKHREYVHVQACRTLPYERLEADRATQ